MISFRIFFTVTAIAATILIESVLCCWLRSALIYHDANRSSESWKRNFMRITENGDFTGQWLFDHAILTTTFINKKDIMYGGLDGKDIQNTLNILIQDALAVDKAITDLISSPLPPPPTKIKLSLAFPYIDSQDRYVTLEGKEYHLSNKLNRLDLATWYIEKVNSFRLSKQLKNVEIIGLYYHREDAIDLYDDLDLIKHFNKEIHNLKMKSVWVPYYNAPHAWDGKELGFDVLVIQPGYSFASSIDGGTATGDRLHSLGHSSANRSQCFEYELRGSGYSSQLEYWIAHQYLAIAQETGAWKFPQVFFVGGTFFDGVTSRKDVNEYTWLAYSDLTDYLNGKIIPNLEVKIKPFKVNDCNGNVLRKVWKVPPGYSALTSIRLDFNDLNGYWRGQLQVTIVSNDGSSPISSFSHRFGQDVNSPEYSAVFVPLADLNIKEGTELIIELSKEFNSPWPFIHQLVGAKYEPPYISNPVYEELSLSTRSDLPGPYADSVSSHREYSSGKLTDGKLSPSGNWDWDGVMGWNLIPEGAFSILINLGQVFPEISKVKIYTHYDQGAGVRLPTKLTVLIGQDCAPHLRGRLISSCYTNVTSGQPKFTSIGSFGSDEYVITLPFESNPSGKYVVITGIPLAWFLLDEIQVINSKEHVISQGAQYKVTPIPGEGKGPSYGDNDRRLVDGAVFKTFILGRGVDGFDKEDGKGSVEATWGQFKLARSVFIWLTEPLITYGVGFPKEVNIQIRDENNQWLPGVNVTTSLDCGPAPCAKLSFQSDTKTSGVRGNFFNIDSWVMVSEISIA